MQPKTKKIVIASSIIGAIAILATAMIIRGKRKKLEAKIKSGSPDVIVPAKSTTSNVLFPLKKGSGVTNAEKNAVRVVQRYLNARSSGHFWLSIAPLVEDGIFGSLTESALSKLSGVTQVSYTLYKDMQNFLTPVFLNPNTAPYTGASIDPTVQKNYPISQVNMFS